MSHRTGRLVASLFSVVVGGATSLLVLRTLQPWAWATEGKNFQLWTAAHCVLLFVLLLWWFGEREPTLANERGILLSTGNGILGAMLSLLLGPGGLALLVTGHAFIDSMVATVVYAVLAPALPPEVDEAAED